MPHNLRQYVYVLYQATRASYLAQEKNSALGLVWHLLNPLFMTAVLFVVFSNVDRFKEIEQYQLFILIGLIHYNFFINSTTRSSGYFLNSRSLILNTTVPQELLILRQICIEGFTLIVEVMLVLALGVFFGANFTWMIALYPLIFLAVLALSLGASLFLCSLVVFLSDLNYVWSLFCRLLFFLTPVFFAPDVVGEGKARILLELNPLTGIVTLARECLLYGGTISAGQMALAMVGPALVLLLGVVVFRSTRARIPDFI